MISKLAKTINRTVPAPVAEAHCDGPCGVYDPASARIARPKIIPNTACIRHPIPPYFGFVFVS